MLKQKKYKVMILTKESENQTAEKALTHALIRGEFQAVEAEEIINHMLMTKINFQGRKSFSSQIRFGHNDEASLTRIKELEETKDQLEELIEYAKANELTMRISSNISVELL